MNTENNDSKKTKTPVVNRLSRPSLMSDFNKDFDNLVKTLFWDGRWSSDFMKTKENLFPQLNFSEKDNKYCVEIDLPGVDPKEVELSLSDNTLTLKGERKAESEQKEAHYHRSEKSHGHFMRTITFPEKVDQESVTAESKNGVLLVQVQKAEEAIQKAKKIEIKCS